MIISSSFPAIIGVNHLHEIVQPNTLSLWYELVKDKEYKYCVYISYLVILLHLQGAKFFARMAEFYLRW